MTPLDILLLILLVLVGVAVLLWTIGVALLAYYYHRSMVARMAIREIPRQFTGIKGVFMIIVAIPMLMTLFVPFRNDIVPTDVTDDHRR